jgi:mannose-1-phosphate guanylyltransferase/mannose-6-phosphate isomerase
MPSLTPVILCGGSGTRLWPLSRENHPKQLLSLVNEDSLLQATVRRIDGLTDIKQQQPLIVCNEEYRFVIAEQLRVMGRDVSILLEPVGRNTAPALTLAALATKCKDDDPVLLVMPSDHIISDTSAFQAAVRQGMALAIEGNIITFGITPDKPETGYGYIQSGKTIKSIETACYIKSFVEKPDLVTAQAYIDDPSYLWNSGLFMMRASVWLSAIGKFRPDIQSACQTAWANKTVDGDFLRINKTAFEQCPSDSIDYAVMEKIASHNNQPPISIVIPLAAGWSDIGTWDSLWQVLPKDECGNVSQGDVLLQDCDNILAISESRLVTCVGIKDIIVVETPDAVLVAHKDNTQNVKKIVDCLKRNNRIEGRTHRKVTRPWGWYDAVDNGENFQVKRIVVNPGAALSLQMHHHRAEHWIVVRGTAKVTRGDETYLVPENESTFIPLGTRHRLENPGRAPLELIEVQSGSYLGEEDIVRFEDNYGRENN